MSRFASPTLLAAVVLSVAIALSGAALARAALSPNLVPDQPCPDRPRHARPSGFHFSPGLTAHQSWVEVTVPEIDATDFVLCLDGALVADHIGQTPRQGVVKANVRTTWVNVERLLGRLEAYKDPGRWDLGYTTYTLRGQAAPIPSRGSQPGLNSP